MGSFNQIYWISTVSDLDWIPSNKKMNVDKYKSIT